jgi:hypothetical protein
MTRKFVLALLFTTLIVSHFSFSGAATSSTVATVKTDARQGWDICIGVPRCRICGTLFILPRTVLACLVGECGPKSASICIQLNLRTNPDNGKQEADESTVTFEYADPSVKGSFDEEAYKAEFIQQVNAHL